MVAVTQPNDLGGLSSVDSSSEMVRLVAAGGDVRELQRTLWACAKRSPERRFHALFDRIHRSDVLLERGIRRYYLHRWPSLRAMKRIRQRVKAKTGRNRVGIKDVRELIAQLNPILRGWGSYFRTGNATEKFRQIDRYVAWRLKRLLVKRKGRNLRAGEAAAWTEDWFAGLGLHRLLGTIGYPGTA